MREYNNFFLFSSLFPYTIFFYLHNVRMGGGEQTMLLLGLLVLSIALMTLGLAEFLVSNVTSKRWVKVTGVVTTIIGVLLFLGVAVYFLFVVLPTL